jgi:DnaJ family protein C protein 27
MKASAPSSSSKKAAPSASTTEPPSGLAPFRIKVLSMGSAGSGKSCLIKRYCEERFVTKYIATIGVDYGVKPVKVDGADVRVNFWDLSGHKEFLEVRNEFYKDTQGVLLLYDVSSRESFDELDGWLTEATKYGANPRELPVVLCANKADKKRAVSEDEGRQYAVTRGLTYFETSASSGQNVHEMFDFLFREVVRAAEAQ